MGRPRGGVRIETSWRTGKCADDEKRADAGSDRPVHDVGRNQAKYRYQDGRRYQRAVTAERRHLLHAEQQRDWLGQRRGEQQPCRAAELVSSPRPAGSERIKDVRVPRELFQAFARVVPLQAHKLSEVGCDLELPRRANLDPTWLIIIVDA